VSGVPVELRYFTVSSFRGKNVIASRAFENETKPSKPLGCGVATPAS
jgi:hypothetical protein